MADRAAGDSVTGRFTRPEEVADLVLLLASDRVTNLTGTDLVIDGGLISTPVTPAQAIRPALDPHR